MDQNKIKTIDLQFQGKPLSIASYAIPHKDGVVLVESGPGSTLPGLENGLNVLGYKLSDITDVLLTHIHLDHAGAAGALARQGATIHVHPKGARHLIDPSKLISSATRIYGERMDTLWGEILPVPEEKVSVLEDGSTLRIGELMFDIHFTPGHAEHHVCYFMDKVCFSGDVGAVRIPGYRYLRIPMPPPELDLEKWERTLKTMLAKDPKWIAPTHYGIYDDAEWHLNRSLNVIQDIRVWIDEHLSKTLDPVKLKSEFNDWMNEQAMKENLSSDVIMAYALSNPLEMSIDGMIRYWNKILHPETL